MLNLQEIAEATGGTIENYKSAEITGFSIDSRTIEKGNFFISLSGNRVDGKDFLDEAYAGGASGTLVDFTVNRPDLTNLIHVENREKALLDMASYYRNQFSNQLIGITGSWGKTTTKEILASMLERVGITYKSPGNFNTEYGFPLSLLHMEKDADFGVFELGLRYPGDVGKLSRALKPSIAVLTGIGRVHLANFEDRNHLAKEKLRIIDGMDRGDRLMVNADSEFAIKYGWIAEENGINPIFYSLEDVPEAKYLAKEVQISGLSGVQFSLKTDPGRRCLDFGEEEIDSLETNLLSRSNAYNLLAASSTAVELGITTKNIREGAFIDPLPQRLNPRKFKLGWIIDDTYNANPSATRNSLELMETINSSTNKIFIMGDMLELGAKGKSLHAGLAGDVIQSGVDTILGTGSLTKILCEELTSQLPPSEKYSGRTVRWYKNKRSLIKDLPRALSGGQNVVLVKGSRSMEMEEIVSYLKEI